MIIRYKVKYWEDNVLNTEYGFSASESSIGQAVDRVYDYYGKNNVTEISLYECEQTMCDDEIKETMEASW